MRWSLAVFLGTRSRDSGALDLHVLFPPAAGVHVSGVSESLQRRDVVAGERHIGGPGQTVDVVGLGDADDRRRAFGDSPSCRDLGRCRTLALADRDELVRQGLHLVEVRDDRGRLGTTSFSQKVGALA